MILRSVGRKSGLPPESGYPFSVPAIKALDELQFPSPVTFFVGENGSGKSTLLEGIAAGARAIAIGGDDVDRDASLEKARRLGEHLALVWTRRSRRGFFLRAEDVFNFARRINQLNADLGQISSGFDEYLSGHGLDLARGSVEAQRRELKRRYGEDADARSHGETFLNLFEQRMVPNGLYLMDEPEAALSPLRQLTLISLMKEMVAQDAQFLIATHSPILMAFPEATIFSFDGDRIESIAYDDVEHVAITRSFLKNPESYIRRL